MSDVYARSLQAHEKWAGKLEIAPRADASNAEALTLCYTPGVAQPCRAIHDDPEQAYRLTRKWNTVAVVTDGSAVLGLGNIGALAGLPVMEGKAVLFKQFGGVDAVPICLSSQSVDDIARAVELIAPSFGGINLEDIAAPRCFEVERRLRASLDIPVFHDDQHGTAVVVLAALTNAFRLTNRELPAARVVINGAGAAGCAIADLLLCAGVTDITLVDKAGVLVPSQDGLDRFRGELAARTNPRRVSGGLADAIKGADAFIGVSAAGALPAALIPSMARDAVVFAMANPTPEIMPEEALAAGAGLVGTGRSDYPNQINNVLCFPGLFRGVLDCRARSVEPVMLLAAADALSSLMDDDLDRSCLLPRAFDPRVGPAVAGAVARAARETGIAQT